MKNSMSLKIFYLIIALLLNACAGGGGGSSGGSSSLTPEQFRTAEYNAQYGLAMVNAANLYAKNGNGTNIKVAVFDSGVNPIEAKTGSSIKIDTANSYDYVTNTAGSSADPNGHGTHVAGIIGAPKNDSGMHGIAYEATVLNMRMYTASGVNIGSSAATSDAINRSLAAGAMIINNSSGVANTPITSWTWTSSEVSTYKNFVANGGVVVYAAGNDGQSQVSVQAGIPYRVAGLEAGWLAVMAVGKDGNRASYSNACGVAKGWCLAAPGSEIYSMSNTGGYATMSGTSMAAPMVSGALASLKSAFPNLSYQQVRDRLLATANKTGVYANSDIYGQGLMDLNAATNPVGGLAITTSSSATGSVASATNSRITLPAGLASAIRGQKILVVDGYQRAPFFMSSNNLVSSAPFRGDLGMQHLNDLSVPLPTEGAQTKGVKYSYTRDMNAALSVSHKSHQLSFSSGTKSEGAIGRSLGLAHIPHLSNSGTNSHGAGYATSLYGVKVAAISSIPNSHQLSIGNVNLSDRSSMGNRSSHSMVAQKDHETFSYGGTFSMAKNFSQPAGVMGSGAFSLGSSGATSKGGFFSHRLFDGNTSILYAGEVTSMSSANNGLTSLGNAKYSSLKATVSHALSEFTNLSFSANHQQAIGGQMNVRLPTSIDENGNISYQNYSTGFNNLINSSRLNFDIAHQFDKASRIRSGVIYQQMPYGQRNLGIGAFFEQRL
ncbi:S8 family peptidase [Polynucleobacter sp. IMCC 30228]|uniref:S8 family peptidase n=1 Tax=Polynucleobacter sp. IMCC 30228 TaxID=2781011 RepID=UPI001F3DC380|nr:S8 family peptidase [Polynucleobacter sp. IMCC 30228]MCE7528259.1 S8 family serine peptidase [Polynucleobacter sp. IMCC 30228]